MKFVQLSEKLAQLSKLHTDGALSEEEYQRQKSRILSNDEREGVSRPTSSNRRGAVVSAALYSLALGVAITVLSDVLKLSGVYIAGWFIPAHTFIVDSLIGVPFFGTPMSHLFLSLIQSFVALAALVMGAAGMPSVAQRLGATAAVMVVATASGIVATVAVALINGVVAGLSIFTLQDGGILSIGVATILAFGGGLMLASGRARR